MGGGGILPPSRAPAPPQPFCVGSSAGVHSLVLWNRQPNLGKLRSLRHCCLFPQQLGLSGAMGKSFWLLRCAQGLSCCPAEGRGWLRSAAVQTQLVLGVPRTDADVPLVPAGCQNPDCRASQLSRSCTATGFVLLELAGLSSGRCDLPCRKSTDKILAWVYTKTQLTSDS